MVFQKVFVYNGIKDIFILRINFNIETAKEDGSGLFTSRFILSIVNSVLSVF